MFCILPVKMNLMRLVCLLALIGSSRARSATNHLETNEITPFDYEERSITPQADLRSGLTLCSEGSVCGYLQANSRGVNKQQLCACPSGPACTMTWDSFDGRSLTQGSDQYKFCGEAPKLSKCEPHMTAYTSRLVYSTLTEKSLLKSDHLHCICEETHSYLMANQQFSDGPDNESEIMEITFVCSPVNPKCQCPADLRCPTVTDHGKKRFPMGNGFVSMIRCQR